MASALASRSSADLIIARKSFAFSAGMSKAHQMLAECLIGGHHLDQLGLIKRTNMHRNLGCLKHMIGETVQMPAMNRRGQETSAP
jgi:hypothetical protein